MEKNLSWRLSLFAAKHQVLLVGPLSTETEVSVLRELAVWAFVM